MEKSGKLPVQKREMAGEYGEMGFVVSDLQLVGISTPAPEKKPPIKGAKD